jgi:hypothetical protein
MAIIKEYREFFLRNIAVNSGAKKDQETGYPLEYIITGIGSVFNRFLKNHYPSEGVNKKLFESITFKLNVEDTASTTAQGLVRAATDQEAFDKTSNGAGTFTNVLQPHQFPDLTLEADINDTLIGSAEKKGLKATTNKRIIAGKFWKKYTLEVNRDKSIVIDGTTQKIQLDGDVASPGNIYYYGTNSSGVKGFYPINKQYTYISAGYIGTTIASYIGHLAAIGSYLLDTVTIAANTIGTAGDEIIYETIGDVITVVGGGLGVTVKLNGTTLYIAAVDLNKTTVLIIKCKIIVRDLTNGLFICEVFKPTDSNPIETFTSTITFDPTIINTLTTTVDNVATGADQYKLVRSELTFKKQL